MGYSLFIFGFGYTAQALAKLAHGEGWEIGGTSRNEDTQRLSGYNLVDFEAAAILPAAEWLTARGQKVITILGGRSRERVLTNLKRVSKPGRRIYAPKDRLPRVLGGMGVTVPLPLRSSCFTA